MIERQFILLRVHVLLVICLISCKESSENSHAKLLADKWHQYWNENGYFHTVPEGEEPPPLATPFNAPLAGENPLYLDPDGPIEDRLDDLIDRMTLEEKAMALNHKGPTLERFGLRSDAWNQALNGVRWPSEYAWSGQYDRSDGLRPTIFPVPIAMGASWDPDLLYEVMTAVGDEARAIYHGWKNDPDFEGVKQGLIYRDPVINISRNPYWGRIYEVFSEDSYLTGRMAVAYVKALHGDHSHYLKLATTLKHYAVNNVETGRFQLNAQVGERWLHEYWLPHFRDAVVEGKANSLMASYNAINDVPNNMNRWLLTDLLKNEWKHEGFVVSDLGGVKTMVEGHGKSKLTYLDAVAQSIMAGCDFSGTEYMNYIPPAVQQGLISEERLNDALRRVLRVRMRLGEFDPMDRIPWNHLRPYNTIGTQQHRELSLKAAQKSIVLLQNKDGLLPLDPMEAKSMAVIGPLADRFVYSQYTSAPGEDASTPLKGLQERFPQANITYVYGASLESPVEKAHGITNLTDPDALDTAAELKKAVEAAGKADLTLLFVGNGFGNEHEHQDRTTLYLPGTQLELVKAVLAVNPRTAIIYITAGPISEPWIKEKAPAVLQAWWPGDMGGLAIADVLFGKVNPGARLPYTVYASDEQVPSVDEYNISTGFTYMYLKGEPLYPFGHGLSYTSFEYSDLTLSEQEVEPEATVNVNLKVQNTGKLAGDEVVQVYAGFPDADIVRPTKQLAGFKRITLEPGESAEINIPVQISRLAYWDERAHGFVVAEGEHTFHVGASSADLRLHKRFVVSNK